MPETEHFPNMKYINSNTQGKKIEKKKLIKMWFLKNRSVYSLLIEKHQNNHFIDCNDYTPQK